MVCSHFYTFAGTKREQSLIDRGNSNSDFRETDVLGKLFSFLFGLLTSGRICSYKNRRKVKETCSYN